MAQDLRLEPSFFLRPTVTYWHPNISIVSVKRVLVKSIFQIILPRFLGLISLKPEQNTNGRRRLKVQGA